MKPLAAGALGVLVIGLLFTGPVVFALMLVIVPLVGLALLSAVVLVSGAGSTRRHPRRPPAERGRHVVSVDRRR